MIDRPKIDKTIRTLVVDGTRWEVEMLGFDNGRYTLGKMYFWKGDVRLGPIQYGEGSQDSLEEVDREIERFARSSVNNK